MLAKLATTVTKSPRTFHRSTVVFCVAWMLFSAALLDRGDLISGRIALYSPERWENLEHGWPYTYLTREVHFLGAIESCPWAIQRGVHTWFPKLFLVDVAVLAAIGIVCSIAWELSI